MTEDSSAQPYLMMRDPDGNMTRVTLDKLPITIGRRSTNDLQVLDPTVSRDHARIARSGTEFHVEDLGSTHGTYVNQERIDKHVLGPNDRIRLGGAMGHTLTFRTGGEFTMLIGTTGKVTGTSVPKEAGQIQEENTRSLIALLEISKALNSSLHLPDVLEKVMDAVIALTDGERCMMLLGGDVENLEIAAQRNLTNDESLSNQYSLSVVRELFATGESQILTDVAEDERFSAQQSIVGLHLRTVMCVPLLLSHFTPPDQEELDGFQTSGASKGAKPRILGALYVDRRSPTRHFSDQDLSVLESFAGHAGVAIDNARLYEEALEKRRMEEDLRVANRIQRSLLLSDFPEADWFEVHALNVPSRGVGGDYYEFFRAADGALGFAVGDVSGKGIPAAMLMATLQAAFLAAAQANDELDFVCSHVNNFIVERTSPERYATFFVGILDPDGSLQYVNAGHNPALLFADGECKQLFGGGLPLGLFPGRTYEVQNTVLPVGASVVVYSDGVTEANDTQGEEYELARLEAKSREHLGEGARAISKAIFEDVERFSSGAPQGDDLTLMVVKRTG